MHAKLNWLNAPAKQSLKLTKMICTIGPASNSVETLKQLLKSGMNICRLNFSHGSHEMHLKQLNSIREAIMSNPVYEHTGIMLDTKGPEIRTGMLLDKTKPITLKKGQKLKLTTDYTHLGTNESIAISYEELYNSVEVNSRILAADGNLTLKVIEKCSADKTVIVEVQNDFLLGEKKNVNLPGVKVKISVITEKDRVDLIDFGIKQNVDFIALSFTTTAECIKLCRDVLGEKGKTIKIIAKIENQEGLLNAGEILRAADGLMIARGDLGMEMDPAKLFIAQTYLTRTALKNKKPVIMATQLMESMVYHPRPTRAEITDVACAVESMNDCTMLSGETGGGHFPIEAASTMSEICQEMERFFPYKEKFYERMKNEASLENKKSFQREDKKHLKSQSLKDAYQNLAKSAVIYSMENESSLIICISENPAIVNELSALRPKAPVFYVHHNKQILRGFAVDFGVYQVSIYEKLIENENELIKKVEEQFLLRGMKVPKRNIVLVDGNKLEYRQIM